MEGGKVWRSARAMTPALLPCAVSGRYSAAAEEKLAVKLPAACPRSKAQVATQYSPSGTLKVLAKWEDNRPVEEGIKMAHRVLKTSAMCCTALLTISSKSAASVVARLHS